MRHLAITKFGPIQKADLELGDLNVLVGPQASGKSLLVQLMKAIADAGAIRADLKRHGFDWLHGEDMVADYSSLYFGGGLQRLITKATTIHVDGRSVSFDKIVRPGGRASQEESMFLVPAQRVLVLQDGWPKPFMAYSVGDPYSMRRFSDALRVLMENGLGRAETLFPLPKRLMAPLRKSVDDSIYVGFKLKLETEGLRKRVVLSPSDKEPSLPFNAWSAGQREFTPLLLSMYWLMPPTKTPRRGALTDVIVEEPEMGLHPQAILSFGLLVMALLQRDYRVTISTHSPVILDLVWALQCFRDLKRAAAIEALRRIFGVDASSQQLSKTFESVLEKKLRVFYFNRAPKGVVVQDISSLDPGAEDPATAGWGGLSGFSGRIAETVGEALQKRER